jgi:hypothetical protein
VTAAPRGEKFVTPAITAQRLALGGCNRESPGDTAHAMLIRVVKSRYLESAARSSGRAPSAPVERFLRQAHEFPSECWTVARRK